MIMVGGNAQNLAIGAHLGQYMYHYPDADPKVVYQWRKLLFYFTVRYVGSLSLLRAMDMNMTMQLFPNRNN